MGTGVVADIGNDRAGPGATAAGGRHPLSGLLLQIASTFGRRLLLLLILLALVFVAVDLLPGNAARAALGMDATDAEVAAKSQELGLDDPLYVRFFNWVSGLVTGDLGTTTLGTPISETIGSRLPNTVLLATLALAVTSVLAVLGGGAWMLRPHGILARVLSPMTMMLLALPEFVVAIMLVLIFSLGLGLFPAVTMTTASGVPAGWDMLVLPTLSLALPQAAWNVRVVRSALVDAAAQPHVEAAVLDGYSKWHVLFRHILPIAVPTISASIGTTTAMLFGGALVVEAVFNYPGLGSLVAGSVASRDTTLAATIVAVSAVTIMCVLFVADALRSWSTRGRL
jgi:peptide/nickel transport system permease protein